MRCNDKLKYTVFLKQKKNPSNNFWNISVILCVIAYYLENTSKWQHLDECTMVKAYLYACNKKI